LLEATAWGNFWEGAKSIHSLNCSEAEIGGAARPLESIVYGIFGAETDGLMPGGPMARGTAKLEIRERAI